MNNSVFACILAGLYITVKHCMRGGNIGGSAAKFDCSIPQLLLLICATDAFRTFTIPSPRLCRYHRPFHRVDWFPSIQNFTMKRQYMLSDVPSAKRKPPLSTPAGTYATAANMGSGLEPCALCLEVIASIAAGPDGEDEVRSNTIGSLLDLSSQPNILGEAVNFLAKLEGLAEEHILASDIDKCSSGW